MPIVHDPESGRFVRSGGTSGGTSAKRATEKAHNKSTAATLKSYKASGRKRESKSARELFG